MTRDKLTITTGTSFVCISNLDGKNSIVLNFEDFGKKEKYHIGIQFIDIGRLFLEKKDMGK